MITESRWTRTHVIRSAATEILTNSALNGKAEIGESYVGSIARAKDIFGFDVAMKDPKIMTVLNSVDQLYERRFYEPAIITKKVLSCDRRKEVPPSTKIQNDIDEPFIREELMEGNDIWVTRHQLVESKLALLEEVGE